MTYTLPIDVALPELLEKLHMNTAAVLVAPPGAGKTTRVPLALLDALWLNSKTIILLEPRRLAARAAATRMAELLGEPLGKTVGLRMRMESHSSSDTRILVVTEGVFARMALEDPSLEGVGAVLFDEFHERSLDADFGLALALEVQGALRDDLRILVMSATLDSAPVSALLGNAPVVVSEGRSFPVETRHLPRNPQQRIEDAVAAAIAQALEEETGNALVFLPGQAEIRRVEERLAALPPSIKVLPLHGGLDNAAQKAALAPARQGERHVILATAIAETSLTIDGVRIVIDSGLARVPEYDASAGITRLASVRVSQAAANQRRGRAGRTSPGVCYRLWEEAATGGLNTFATPEILAADLTSLALELAFWGEHDPSRLKWLNAPPASAWTEAIKLLQILGALNASGSITPRGKVLRGLPLHPRLAAMVLDSPPDEKTTAAHLAVLLGERGLGGQDTDMRERLRLFVRDNSPRARSAKAMAKRWAGKQADDALLPEKAGIILARAFPDRMAQARGAIGTFRMANGRGAQIETSHALAHEPYLVIADLTGKFASSRIMQAVPLSRIEMLEAAGSRYQAADEVSFDAETGNLRARAVERIDALVLASAPKPLPQHPDNAAELAEGLAQHCWNRLPWPENSAAWRARVMFLWRQNPALWPDMCEKTLKATATQWLAPYLAGINGLGQLTPSVLDNALKALVPYNQQRQLDALAPSHFKAPSGSVLPIDYSSEEPTLAVRVQELFGLAQHPSVGQPPLPLTLTLLSPAHRPVQVTRDLVGFWRGSYAAVRTDLRGRYPKHSWPEDPLAATATARAKPRGT